MALSVRALKIKSETGVKSFTPFCWGSSLWKTNSETLLCWSFMEQLLFSFFFASMASKEILLLEEMLFVLIEWWLCKNHSHQRSVARGNFLLNFWAAKATKTDSCCMLARKQICSSTPVFTHITKRFAKFLLVLSFF